MTNVAVLVSVPGSNTMNTEASVALITIMMKDATIHSFK